MIDKKLLLKEIEQFIKENPTIKPWELAKIWDIKDVNFQKYRFIKEEELDEEVIIQAYEDDYKEGSLLNAGLKYTIETSIKKQKPWELVENWYSSDWCSPKFQIKTNSNIIELLKNSERLDNFYFTIYKLSIEAKTQHNATTKHIKALEKIQKKIFLVKLEVEEYAKLTGNFAYLKEIDSIISRIKKDKEYLDKLSTNKDFIRVYLLFNVENELLFRLKRKDWYGKFYKNGMRKNERFLITQAYLEFSSIAQEVEFLKDVKISIPTERSNFLPIISFKYIDGVEYELVFEFSDNADKLEIKKIKETKKDD